MKADIHFVVSDVKNFLDNLNFFHFISMTLQNAILVLSFYSLSHFMGKTAVTMLQCNTARLNLERGQHLKKRGVYF